jgi:TonB family protein
MVTGVMPRIPRTARGRHEAPDLTWYVGGTSAGVGVLLFLLAAIPADAAKLSSDTIKLANRYVPANIAALQDQDEVPDWARQKKNELGENRGTRARGDEGRAGKKDSPKQQGRLAIKGEPTNPDPHLGKSAADLARTMGALGTLRQQSGPMASIFGRDAAIGRDAETALGGLIGTQVGEQWGVGGWGLVGPGRGGGGTGEGTYGFGNLGTIGLCRGPNCGPGYGNGDYFKGIPGRDRGYVPSGPVVSVGTIKLIGSLDRDIIRRIIRSHMKEVKFCYEKELVRKPSLCGRVAVRFTITGTGVVSVSAIESSTLGDAAVEQCIAQAVHRWEFPRPENGGLVLVTYPFVLHTGGAR